MLQTAIYEDNTAEYEAWFEKYHEVYESVLIALKQQLGELSWNARGLEVGVGTGRFAAPLCIADGTEPERGKAKLARRHGIRVSNAHPEYLPYRDGQFDFVLFVTICQLNDVKIALEEAHRVLKKGGSVIIGFIDRNSPAGKTFEQKRYGSSSFYLNARYYTVEEVADLLGQGSFSQPAYVQTIFRDLEAVGTTELPEPGHGKGSFVVVRAVK